MPNIKAYAVKEVYQSAEDIGAVAFHIAQLLKAAATGHAPAQSTLIVCAASSEWIHNEVELNVKTTLDIDMFRSRRP